MQRLAHNVPQRHVETFPKRAVDVKETALPVDSGHEVGEVLFQSSELPLGLAQRLFDLLPLGDVHHGAPQRYRLSPPQDDDDLVLQPHDTIPSTVLTRMS